MAGNAKLDALCGGPLTFMRAPYSHDLSNAKAAVLGLPFACGTHLFRAALPNRRAATPEPADLSRIVTVHPKTFNDAKTIGESFRDGFPVIMNLTDMEDYDAKRLVDFAAGLIFGLRGTFEKVTNKVFLLSPNEVTVTAEDRERIAGGFYNQS